jgi:hypothetical protein
MKSVLSSWIVFLLIVFACDISRSSGQQAKIDPQLKLFPTSKQHWTTPFLSRSSASGGVYVRKGYVAIRGITGPY